MDAGGSAIFGTRWGFQDASPSEWERATLDDAVMLRASGTSPGDSSPFASLATDPGYEIEVTLEVEPGATGALLLYFNPRLYCGMAWDGERMTSYAGGVATHWREPAEPGRIIRLRLVNDRHIVTGFHAAEGEPWVRHGVRYDTSGYHSATIHDLKSLRPALAAFGSGSVRFRDFSYRALS